MRIQSPHNLGDLGLHITYIRNFASGVRLWPDSPLFVFSKLRYPAGMDLFNALLIKLHFDLRHQLAITGLLACLGTFYALYRWSGAFGLAGFLFNGGVAGYQFLNQWQFLPYQDGPNISWKSIPLTMFVTQRGLLYAIPAGLLLLWQWRTLYGPPEQEMKRALPVWLEYLLYATMPLFHVHTFLALNFVVILLFVGRPESRRHLLLLAATAFLPATMLIWLITDHFHAKSVFDWHPGWTQNTGEFEMPFLSFWWTNFGILLPLAIILVGSIARREWGNQRATSLSSDNGGSLREIPRASWQWARKFVVSIDTIFVAAAALIFLFACLVKTAPWEWDNMKILIWAYFLILPALWRILIRPWPAPVRIGVCLVLFFSGFVNLFGGLAADRTGLEFANRVETDLVADAVRKLPVEARFAAFPTYNHPLLLNGRKVVCGYTGHLWTQGLDYTPVENKLQLLMLGQGNWVELARELHVDYLFWGREEKANYPASTHPWEGNLPVAAQGSWGAIYDFSQSH